MEMNTQRMDAFMKDVTECRKAIDLCCEAIKKLKGKPMRLLISDGPTILILSPCCRH